MRFVYYNSFVVYSQNILAYTLSFRTKAKLCLYKEVNRERFLTVLLVLNPCYGLGNMGSCLCRTGESCCGKSLSQLLLGGWILLLFVFLIDANVLQISTDQTASRQNTASEATVMPGSLLLSLALRATSP